MPSLRSGLLSGTAIRLFVGTGLVLGTAGLLSACSQFGGGGTVVAAANPCGAANPCAAAKAAACNPCAVKAAACNPCNPCAAKNPCNPCGAAACNPCNPCAAAAGGGTGCVIPRLRQAAANPCAAKNPCAAGKVAACNPCNPCAAKNPCNPCAAKNPCNPCTAKKPCNPCAAAVCNPCNPCGAAASVELTEAELAEAYDCLMEAMKKAYGASGLDVATKYRGWPRFSRVPYQSATHGSRYVQNHASPDGAAAYGRFEKVGRMPAGAVAAKDSFVVQPDGTLALGPLSVMEKLPAGSSAGTGDWKYTMVMPNGQVMAGGQTQFCADCHMSASDTDSLFFIPEEYRIATR